MTWPNSPLTARAAAGGSSITLDFSDSGILSANTPITGFTVSGNAVISTAFDAYVRKVILSVAAPVVPGTLVSYTPGNVANFSLTPQSLTAFSNFPVSLVPPTSINGQPSTDVSGTTITCVLLDASGATPASGTIGFSLDGTDATVQSWSISGDSLTLVLGGTIYMGQEPTLSYNAVAGGISNGAGPMADIAFLGVFNASNVVESVLSGTHFSETDIDDAYGEKYVDQWSSFSTDDAPARSPARIQKAINVIEGVFAGEMRESPYIIPLQPLNGVMPAEVKSMLAELAGFWLWKTRGLQQAEDTQKWMNDRQEAAMLLLRKMAGGYYRLACAKYFTGTNAPAVANPPSSIPYVPGQTSGARPWWLNV